MWGVGEGGGGGAEEQAWKAGGRPSSGGCFVTNIQQHGGDAEGKCVCVCVRQCLWTYLFLYAGASAYIKS